MNNIEEIAAEYYAMFHEVFHTIWNELCEDIKKVWRNFTPLIHDGIWIEEKKKRIPMITSGEMMYNCYLIACGGRSISSGQCMYDWSDLSPNIKQNWIDFSNNYNDKYVCNIVDEY